MQNHLTLQFQSIWRGEGLRLVLARVVDFRKGKKGESNIHPLINIDNSGSAVGKVLYLTQTPFFLTIGK